LVLGEKDDLGSFLEVDLIIRSVSCLNWVYDMGFAMIPFRARYLSEFS